MPIQYINRDFTTFVEDLKNFAKTRFPEDFIYLNDASPDMMYLEMVAYMGTVLGDNLDKSFNESFISEAQSRGSLIRAANDFNFTNYTKTPSATQLKVSITVPFIIEDGIVKPDPDLLPNVKSIQAISTSGVSFENIGDINFADPQNRIIVPNFNSNNEIISFKVTKSVVIRSGITKIQRIYIDSTNIKPFLPVTIADTDVTEVVGVIGVPGNQFQLLNDSLFDNLDYTYSQVDFLAQDKMFVELQDSINQTSQIKQGEWVAIPKRFIVKKDINDLVTLYFGSSTTNFDLFESLIQSYLNSDISLNSILNNNTLGEIPAIDSTLFIKYRTGGGTDSNVQAGQITNIASKEFYPQQVSVDYNKLSNVRNSMEIINELPAVGGRDALSIEEMRYTLPKVFAAQNRVVTYEDVKGFIAKMPPKFGAPYKVSCEAIKPGIYSLSDIYGYLAKQLMLVESNNIYYERRRIIDETLNTVASLGSNLAMIPVGSSNPISQTGLNNLLLDENNISLWIGEKCRIYILGIDEAGKLVTTYKDANGIWQYPNELLKTNIKNWLLDKRVIGDWIDIVDARVVNLQFDFTIIADNNNKQETLAKCLQRLKDYFSVANWQLGQSIYMANVQAILQEIKGVINVVDMKFYNIWGTDNRTGRKYADMEPGRYRHIDLSSNTYNANRFAVKLVNNTVKGYADTFFEIKFPDLDITGRVL